MTGIVIGHGGRAPGSRLFRDEVEELERRGHLVIATDCSMAGEDDREAELRTFDEAMEVQRLAVDELWARELALAALGGPTRFFQQGTRDEIVPYDAARRLFELTVEPKRWREYDCDHGIDAHPQARLDRYVVLDEVLR